MLGRDPAHEGLKYRQPFTISTTLTALHFTLNQNSMVLAIKREFNSWARAPEAAFPAQKSSAD
ncbi:MAG: hypothetical protein RJB11_1068 [Planctomycetota bacterium]|jgi:hypothetical protein